MLINEIVKILGLLGLGSIIDRILTYLLNKKGKENEEKLLVYRELNGIRILLRQLFVSRTEAYIFSDYYELRYKLTKNEWDFKEAERWMHKSEDYVIKITDCLKDLFSILAISSRLFKNNSEIQFLIARLYKYKTITINKPPEKISIEKLDQWKTKAIKESQNFIEIEYGKSIENLIKKISKTL